jgi:hypothetical protein
LLTGVAGAVVDFGAAGAGVVAGYCANAEAAARLAIRVAMSLLMMLLLRLVDLMGLSRATAAKNARRESRVDAPYIPLQSARWLATVSWRTVAAQGRQ